MRKTRPSAEACCKPEVAPRAASGKRDNAAADAEIAAICKALAHPARVQVLRHLLDTGTCVFGSLADVVPLAPSTVARESRAFRRWLLEQMRTVGSGDPAANGVSERELEGLCE